LRKEIFLFLAKAIFSVIIASSVHTFIGIDKAELHFILSELSLHVAEQLPGGVILWWDF